MNANFTWFKLLYELKSPSKKYVGVYLLHKQSAEALFDVTIKLY